MSRLHKDYALDDDDLIGEGVLSEEKLAAASKEFQRLRSEHPNWDELPEERSI